MSGWMGLGMQLQVRASLRFHVAVSAQTPHSSQKMLSYRYATGRVGRQMEGPLPLMSTKLAAFHSSLDYKVQSCTFATAELNCCPKKYHRSSLSLFSFSHCYCSLVLLYFSSLYENDNCREYRGYSQYDMAYYQQG